MNNNNASSSEIDIRKTNNSQAQSLQRGGSSDQQQQIVDEDSSHGDKELAGSTKNGVLLVCSIFAAFCMQALLGLPGDIKPDQLLSPMKITVDQHKNLQSFLRSDVTCFILSVMTILLVTCASSFNYEYSIRLNACMMGALVGTATTLFYYGLVLATNGRLAGDAFRVGAVIASVIMVITYIFMINKKSRSFIRKGWSKIRDSCA
ncbi:hypothetical protein LWI29_030049 [Acer saccharum]|uniref:PGG domain-containing protein n=1 Tax=Acer saccharum TaxID=4024 RepID=A0AA39SVF8_ACESA|nr:hypothetical protein LWI29_030049 [Acer saccharum]